MNPVNNVSQISGITAKKKRVEASFNRGYIFDIFCTR